MSEPTECAICHINGRANGSGTLLYFVPARFGVSAGHPYAAMCLRCLEAAEVTLAATRVALTNEAAANERDWFTNIPKRR